MKLQYDKEQAEIQKEQLEYEIQLKREYEREQAEMKERERAFEREQVELRQSELRENLELIERETEMREIFSIASGTSSSTANPCGGYMKGPKLPCIEEVKDDMDAYICKGLKEAY